MMPQQSGQLNVSLDLPAIVEATLRTGDEGGAEEFIRQIYLQAGGVEPFAITYRADTVKSVIVITADEQESQIRVNVFEPVGIFVVNVETLKQDLETWINERVEEENDTA